MTEVALAASLITASIGVALLINVHGAGQQMKLNPITILLVLRPRC